MPDQASLEQMVQALGQNVQQVAQNQAAQNQALSQLVQGTQATHAAASAAAQRAGQPQPSVDQYQALNSRYLEMLATDPIGLRNTERQQITNEVVGAIRQEMAQNLTNLERQRRAEQMERQIFEQHPQLLKHGAQLEWYLRHQMENPQYQQDAIETKIQRAIGWTYQFQENLEQEAVARAEHAKREAARAGGPGGGSFRDPGRADDGPPAKSAEEGNAERFQAMQERRMRALSGGRYVKA